MLKKAIFLLACLLLALALTACGSDLPPADTPVEDPAPETPSQGDDASDVYDWNFLSDQGYDKNRMTEEEINALLERQQLRWEITYKGVLTLKGVCVNAPTFADEYDQPWRDFTTLQSNDAGDGRPALKQVIVEATVMVLPAFAFQNCAELESVTLPATMSKLPDYCFAGCEALTTVTGGMGLASIGDYALSNCSVLQRMEVSEALAEVGYGAFDKSCDKLGFDKQSGEKKTLLLYFRGTEVQWSALYEAMEISPIGNAAFENAITLYVQ